MLGAFLFTIALALAPPTSCEPGTPTRIDVTLKLEVLRAKSISPRAVAQTIDAARSIFSRYGITLKHVRTIDVDDTPPFGTGSIEDVSATGAHAVAGAQITSATKPARALVEKFLRRRDGRVFVLMTSKLAPPDSVVRRAVANLRGLTLVDGGGLLSKAVGMKGRAPLVLLGLAETEPATGRTLAHELGHAVGLEHRDGKGALMRSHEDDCRAVLRAHELRAFARDAERDAEHAEQSDGPRVEATVEHPRP